MTRGWFPQRAGSLGLNGGGAAAAVPPQWRWDGMECCIAAGTWKFIPDQYFRRNGTGKLLRVHFSMTGLHYKCRADTCSSLGGLHVLLQYAD